MLNLVRRRDGNAGIGGRPVQTRNTWLGTARGRVGYASNRWLPWITGGAAFGSEKATLAEVSESKTQIGWTAGAGIEYAFLGSWPAKLEYLYVVLGKWSCSAATCGVASDAKFNTSLGPRRRELPFLVAPPIIPTA